MQRAWLLVCGVGFTGVACLSSERSVGSGVVVGTGDGGAGGAPSPPLPIDPSCWQGQLPPEAQPLPAQSSIADACRIGASPTTQWTYPASSGTIDDRAKIVGRWATCAGSSVVAVPHAGIEFGARGRWGLLTTDTAGALVPMDASVDGSRGYYYLLGTGQLNVTGEGPTSPGGIYFVTFASGMDVLRIVDTAGGTTDRMYARTTPSPLNGDDNLPSVTDGSCSMVGTWDVPGNPVAPVEPPATMSFDAAGNFVGGPRDTDLCAGYTMYGTYRLSSGWFQLTSNVGLGACAWWFIAAYPTQFDADCSHLTLMQRLDGCTGGRGYFNGTTTLTRRP